MEVLEQKATPRLAFDIDVGDAYLALHHQPFSRRPTGKRLCWLPIVGITPATRATRP